MLVRTQYPKAGWLKGIFQKLKSGNAETQTVAKWHAYLQERSMLTKSLLSTELLLVFGPVPCVTTN